VTLDITVNGSGYDQGSVVTLERQGVPAGKIQTNATTFVTSRKLIANITIAADADTGKYDVAVTTLSNRKGVGIELFTVAYVIQELGMLGGTWSNAYAINDRGEVVGQSCTQDCLARAFYWTETGGLEDLGTLPGYTRSAAYAINNRGQAFGVVQCLSGDAACGGVFRQTLVMWDRVGGSWAITPLEGCSVFNEDFPINNNNQCVRRASDSRHLLVQTLSGAAVVGEEPLPSLDPGGTDVAFSISDAAMVAGNEGIGGLAEAVIWYRGVAGAWVILRLGFPGSDNIGAALDVSEPDASGRVWVSGYSGISGARGGYRAVRWAVQADGSGGWRVASIAPLPYAKVAGPQSSDAWGTAVNNAGDVVGFSGNQPVKWPLGGGVQALPVPRGGSSGRAMDINSPGFVVGAVWDRSSGCDRGAIWRLR